MKAVLKISVEVSKLAVTTAVIRQALEKYNIPVELNVEVESSPIPITDEHIIAIARQSGKSFSSRALIV